MQVPGFGLAKTDPVGWMLPPGGVVRQAGGWPAIETRDR